MLFGSQFTRHTIFPFKNFSISAIDFCKEQFWLKKRPPRPKYRLKLGQSSKNMRLKGAKV